MNQTVVIGLLALGAWYFLSGNTSGKPVFTNMNKQIITSIQCGNSVIFDVPGHSLVWLVRTKNGVQDTNGPYRVPIPPYVMNCSTDIGSYVLSAYTLNSDGSKGSLLGITSITVSPSS